MINIKTKKYFDKYENLIIAIIIPNRNKEILIEEFNYINDYFYQYASKNIFNSLPNFNRAIFKQKNIYVRLTLCNNMLIFDGWGNDLTYLESNRKNYIYEKIYTIEDIKSGIINNIINYGVSIRIPTYEPKKLIYE